MTELKSLKPPSTLKIYRPEKYKIWYDKNKDKKLLYSKKYYELNKEKRIQYAKEYRTKNPLFWKISHRKLKYNLSNEDVENMIKIQDNKCAICSVEFHPTEKNRKMSIDHCHTKNIARGLLCNRCNISLGHLEKKDFLKNALKYLKKYE